MKKTAIGLAVVLATQVACLGGPSLVQGRPGDYLEANAPGMVWATLTDGNRMVISGPRVISDTIFGWAEGEEVTLPLDEVKEVRVRKLSIWRSSIMPAAAVGLGVGAIILTTKPKGLPPEDVTQACEDMQGSGVECVDETVVDP